LVAVKTDYKPADTRELFNRLIDEVVKKMDLILCEEAKGISFDLKKPLPFSPMPKKGVVTK
jgi:hypothetical protein